MTENYITITLQEYLDFKELDEHKKEVKITEMFEYHKDGKYNHTGTSVNWRSDGKCWMSLSGKLDRQGDMITEKVQEIKKLKKTIKEMSEMHVWEFRRLKKMRRKGIDKDDI